jgi:hypothetical protein
MDDEINTLLQTQFKKIVKIFKEKFEELETTNETLKNEIQQLKIENSSFKKSEMWSQLNKKNEEIQQLQNEIHFLKKNKIEKKEELKKEEPVIDIIEEDVIIEQPEKKKKKKKKPQVIEIIEEDM